MQTEHSGPVRLKSFPVSSASASSQRISHKMMTPQKALNWAMTNLDVGKMIELLGSSSIDVDERDRACGMQTVLMRLCHLKIHEDDRTTLLRMILSLQPDVNIKDTSGRTALLHVCIAENTEFMQYLSDMPECDAALSDNDGNTPLIHAVRSRKPHVVQALLRCFSNRLNINATNNKGMTALAEAEVKNETAICQILISEGGANPFPVPPIPVSARQTPLSPASSRASSTARKRLDTLPPTVHSQRYRHGGEVVGGGRGTGGLFSPRSQFHTLSRPSSLLGESLSDTSSTVLVPLPEERRSHTMPKKNARKKESASEFAGEFTSTRGQKSKSRKMKNDQSFPNIQNVHGRLVSGLNSESLADFSDSEHFNVVPLTRSTSEESLNQALPKLHGTNEVKTSMNSSMNSSEKPPRRRRKNSASLPNLANSSLIRSTNNVFDSDAENLTAESRILEWERGARTAYRKDTEFKLPPLNVTSLTGALQTSVEWCKTCDRSRALCACQNNDVKTIDNKVGLKMKSGNKLDRILYRSNEHLAVHTTVD